ncbi:uncharacterized protein LOC102900156 [Felis catus]|uniref:uncharacterized protein LOC102900156 n=1 Tax=Felis catus TaxID=9685 RepID=UPI001D19F36E|nr:uncharacterized protein LOC102900156 [Felis catus]
MRTPSLCPREASNRACRRLIGCAVPGRAAEGATCYGLNLMCQVPEHEAVQAMFCRNMCRCLFPRGVLNEVKQPQARPGIEEVTGKCLLKRFGRVSPFPPRHVSHSSRLFSRSAPGSPSPRGSPCTSQASRKACLHSLSSFLTSNFLFNPLLPDLFCSVERLSLSHAAGQPCPWHAGRNLVGSAGEPDGRGGRSPRRSATLHPAFLPDARLASRAQRRASPLLPGSGRSRHLEFSTEETSTRDPAPSGFQIGRLGRKCPCELGGPSKGRGKNAGRGTSLSNGLRAPMTFAHPLEMSGKQNGQIFCLQSFRLSLFKFFIVWD